MESGGEDDEALARRMQDEEDLAAVHEAEAAEAAAIVARAEQGGGLVAGAEPPPARARHQPDPAPLPVPPGAAFAAPPPPNLGTLLGSLSSSFAQHMEAVGRRGPPPMPAHRFERRYQAYSRLVSGSHSLDADVFEHGDKILLPPSALQELSGRNLLETSQDGGGPALFRLTARRGEEAAAAVFGGVLEFSAPPGCAVVPGWMMAHLGAEEGDAVAVQQVRLPRAVSCRLRPVNFGDFRKLESHREVLEATLRGYFTLTRGATIAVIFDDVEYFLQVTEVGPEGDAVCIVNADIATDFDLPEEYFFETPTKAVVAETAAVAPQLSGVAVGSGEGDTPQAGERRCESCRRNVPEHSFARHAAFCERNLHVCPECRERMPKSEQEAHWARAHAPVACEACGEQCPPDMLATHRDFSCPQRRVPCEFCNLPVAAARSEAHAAECGARTERCPRCGGFIMKRHRRAHDETACEFRAPERQPVSPRFVPGFQFACHMCGSDFVAIEDLAMHVSAVHDGGGGGGEGDDRFQADGSSAEPLSDIDEDPSGRSPLSMSMSDD